MDKTLKRGKKVNNVLGYNVLANNDTLDKIESIT